MQPRRVAVHASRLDRDGEIDVLGRCLSSHQLELISEPALYVRMRDPRVTRHAYTASMFDRLRSMGATLRRWWHLLILFLLLRLAAGIILLFFDDAFAWSVELTLIIVAVIAAYVLVALAVRRWSPPRARPSTRR